VGSLFSALARVLLPRQVLAVARRLRPKAWLPESLAEVLSTALPELDLYMRSGVFALGRLLPGMLHPFCHEGSTACVVAVNFATQEVVAANVGDSRGLLIRNGKAIALSEDHKPENAIERKRIENAGGKVVQRGCCWRIDGVLNLSRALGDYYMKATPSLPPEKQKISASPDITKNTYESHKQELLVLACDGLFERKENQDIADFIWPRFQKGMALEKIGQELLRACCARSGMQNGRPVPVEMGTDNETVIILKLPVAKASPSDKNPNDLLAGENVRIHGLVGEAAQNLNGQSGVIESSGDEERYYVRLEDGTVKSIKLLNLTRVMETEKESSARS